MRALGSPVRVDGRQGERLFGVEEVVEAALADIGPGADLGHADGRVAPGPQELAGGLEKSFAGGAGASHAQSIRAVNYPILAF
ncbi:hypothetical protein GCM10010193_23990 [Kitasatospora atroaurantiaca]